ncbi:hypothetical protein WJX79_002439 [Trebouxia sp. C0005]
MLIVGIGENSLNIEPKLAPAISKLLRAFGLTVMFIGHKPGVLIVRLDGPVQYTETVQHLELCATVSWEDSQREFAAGFNFEVFNAVMYDMRQLDHSIALSQMKLVLDTFAELRTSRRVRISFVLEAKQQDHSLSKPDALAWLSAQNFWVKDPWSSLGNGPLGVLDVYLERRRHT